MSKEMTVPQVMAVILNWNSSDDAIRCLDALGRQATRVLVVDNASDGSDLEKIQLAHPHVELLPLDRNYGYAGGMNAGIRRALGQDMHFVWLLNPDTVPEPDALANLLKHSDRYALSASRQTTSESPDSPTREAYVAAADLGWLGRPKQVTCDGCVAGAHDVDVVTGASILIKLESLLRVGIFDERFFHYKEEFDLAFRFSREELHVGLVCDSEVWHARGASLDHASPLAAYYYFRNEVLFLRKHWPSPAGFFPRFTVLHLKQLLVATVARLRGDTRQKRYAKGQLFGYYSGFRGVVGKAPSSTDWR